MSLRVLSCMVVLVGALAFLAPACAMATPCLPGLVAYTDDDGSITLNWPPVANATAYQVLVSPDGGAFTPLSPQATAGASSYTYKPGVQADSYEFAVVPLHGGSNPIGDFCHATVARIPFFPTWTASILGLVGALGGASMLMTRRK